MYVIPKEDIHDPEEDFTFQVGHTYKVITHDDDFYYVQIKSNSNLTSAFPKSLADKSFTVST